MISKQQIKFINSLKHNKYRLKYNCFVAEGLNVITEFVKSGFQIHSVFSTEKLFSTDQKSHYISSDDLKKISFLTNPATTLAVFKKPKLDSESVELINENKTILLDSISDPGNMGTIIRTADWYGIKNLYISKQSVDVFSPKVVQSSMGSLSRVNIYRVDLDTVAKKLKKMNFKLFGATLSGTSIYEFKKPENYAIIFGNESHGISQSLLEILDREISIPSKNKLIDSLNVAVAFGIILSEFR